jgi:mRNA interferase MazF
MAGPLIRRGQFVLVALSGDYGKPRPALVVQSDLFADLPSVVVCQLTSILRADADLFRIDVKAHEETGLRQASQIAVDKLTTIPVSKIGGIIGQADDELMLRVSRSIALFLGVV